MFFSSMLLSLLPLAAIGFIFFYYRKKSRARRADREARERALLQDAGMAVSSRPEVVNAITAQSLMSREPVAVKSGAVLRETLLDQPRTLVYLLLKTSLPEYHVLPRIPLTELFESGVAHSFPHANRLVVDFVICGSAMAPQLVVTIAEPYETHPADEPLAQVGLRHVKLAAGQLPRRDKLRDALGLPQVATRSV